jgi:hypothetical protein
MNMATFETSIPSLVCEDLAYLVEDLDKRHQITASRLIVSMGQNMFAMGGPLRYAFLGRDEASVFVGESHAWFVAKWVFGKRRVRTSTSVARLAPEDKPAALWEMATEDMRGVAWKAPDRRMVDAGWHGLFDFDEARWQSVDDAPMARVDRRRSGFIAHLACLHLMGFRTIGGFKGFLSDVISYAPRFVEIPGPRKDMDGEWAIMALRFGLNIVESVTGANPELKRCRGLLEEAGRAIDAGKVEVGRSRLKVLRDEIEQMNLADDRGPAALFDAELVKGIGLR